MPWRRSSLRSTAWFRAVSRRPASSSEARSSPDRTSFQSPAARYTDRAAWVAASTGRTAFPLARVFQEFDSQIGPADRVVALDRDRLGAVAEVLLMKIVVAADVRRPKFEA